MSDPLAVANLAIGADVEIGVLLADKALVPERLIEAIQRASPGVRRHVSATPGEPRHPVVLSPRARCSIDCMLPADNPRSLRTPPEVIARAADTTAEDAFFDVDSIEAFEQ